MLTPEQEQEIIQLALRRKLLTLEQVELHAPEARTTSTGDVRRVSAPSPPPATTSKRSFPMYGPRLDRLRRLGLLNDGVIEELSVELRSAEMTTETAALRSGELPPSAGSQAVRIQIPLPEPLRRWTRYEILDVLGQGGMGVVYKARDRRLGRLVALKFIRLTDPKMAQRFLNEARAQARITHDNICKVYEVDEVAGQPYIAMEFIDGESVLAISAKLSLVNKVRLMQDIAEALHAAHRIGIIHRDMKPQNVLVEQRPDGKLRPVVMDFGLARDVRSRLNLTESGVVLGTPEYMSPEQARGNSGDTGIDARTDVYSLGAMLYELLCGQPPFEGSTSVQVLISVINELVVPVRMRNPTIPEPLDTIVMTCLSKEPDGRYPTARALAEELGRFLAGEPIRAQRPSSSATRQPISRPATPAPTPNSAAAAVPPASQPPPEAVKTHSRTPFSTGTLLAGALLLTLAVLLGVVVRMRLQRAALARTTAEQGRMALLFSKDVREMELFLRAAYGLPLHNIRREQDHIRRRIARIEGQLPTLSAEALGPANYALGRGAMLLDDWETAQRRLQLALQLGYQAPEVHFALGMVFGARFERAADDARRNPDDGWVGQQLQMLEKQYLLPAQRELELSAGAANAATENEAPAYAQALSQYYRRQYDAALTSIERATSEAPWLPAIAEMEARVLRERASQPGRKDALLYATYDLRRAAESLKRALEMARSNPSLYIEHARVSLLMLQRPSPDERPHQAQQIYEQLLDSCQKALVAQPELATAYGIIASAEAALAARQIERGEDPRPALERGAGALTESSRLGPKEGPLFLTANQLGLIRLHYLTRHGQDILSSLLSALEWAQQGTKLYPSWPALWVDLAHLYLMRAEHQTAQGQESKPDLEEAVATLRRALQAQPQDIPAHAALGQALVRLAARDYNHGENPLPLLTQAREHFSTVLGAAAHRDNAEAGAGLRESFILEAEYRLALGQDAAQAMAEALQTARRDATAHKDSADAQDGLARVLLAQAQQSLSRGEDPSAALAEGTQAIERGHRLRPSDPILLSREGDLFLMAARFQHALRRPVDADLRRAQTALTAALQANKQRADTYVTLARCHLLHAQTSTGNTAAMALVHGLDASAKALAISPGSATALLAQGLLLLAQAERAPVAQRLAMVQPAIAALGSALRANPLLAAEGREALGRAHALEFVPHRR